MRIASGVFCAMMVVFAAVQFNDPDAYHWALIYGICALWSGLAAFRPALVSGVWAYRLLLGTLVIAAVGVVWYFPKTPNFWRTEVWWATETAREGMGMMIAFVALVVAWLAAKRAVARM